MTESPDVPWAKSHDERIKKSFDEPPSPAALRFHELLVSSGITRGRMVDIGCGNGRNAIYFARQGYEVHAVDRSDDFLKDMDMHGVMPHCHSVTDYWLFEDGFFDCALDVFCYSEQKDEEKRSYYRSELLRVMKKGGVFLICVPAGQASADALRKEFAGFSAISEIEFEDRLDGKMKKALGLILRKD